MKTFQESAALISTKYSHFHGYEDPWGPSGVIVLKLQGMGQLIPN